MKIELNKIFEELNQRIETENLVREKSGAARILPVEIQILGQITLLANDVVAKVLPLQRTGDLDARIKSSQHFVTFVL